MNTFRSETIYWNNPRLPQVLAITVNPEKYSTQSKDGESRSKVSSSWAFPWEVYPVARAGVGPCPLCLVTRSHPHPGGLFALSIHKPAIPLPENPTGGFQVFKSVQTFHEMLAWEVVTWSESENLQLLCVCHELCERGFRHEMSDARRYILQCYM